MSEAVQAAVVIERTYKARLEELWALWTTKEGFESWWGPDQFRVEVQRLEPWAGGALDYDMIADTPEAQATMRQMGQPISHGTHATYVDYRPSSYLRLVHIIDFVPGKAPYETTIEVNFTEAGDGEARMITTLHPHPDPTWSRMSVVGYTSQLGKLDRRYGWTGD